MHDVWNLWEGHSIVCMLLTGRTVHVYHYWTYGRDQEGVFVVCG
jgi:hypothetical protein